MNPSDIYHYFVRHVPRMLLYAVLGALIANAISNQHYQSNAPQRQFALVEQVRDIELDQTNDIGNILNKIITLQNQVIDLQQQVKCQLQLTAGGDFTDRAECQRRVEAARQQQTLAPGGSSGSTMQQQANPQQSTGNPGNGDNGGQQLQPQNGLLQQVQPLLNQLGL